MVLLSAVTALYLALIFNSNAFLFLGYAEMILAVLLFICQLLFLSKIQIFIETPFEVVSLSQRVPVRIIVRNYSSLPTGKIAVRLSQENVASGVRTSSVFETTVAGKMQRGEKLYSETVVQAWFEAKSAGKQRLSVSGAWTYDWLGSLDLPVRKKRRAVKSEIFVLPNQYEVPIVVGQDVSGSHEESRWHEQETMLKDNDESKDIRNYQPGDRLRSIHWKLSAKTDELMVREWSAKKRNPLLFFLNVQFSAKRGKKRRQHVIETEAFLTIVVSVCSSLVCQDCIHYVIWYDDIKEEVVRHSVTTQEDVFEMLFALEGIGDAKDRIHLEEAYREKYRDFQDGRVLYLEEEFMLRNGAGYSCSYQIDQLKEQLTSQELFLS